MDNIKNLSPKQREFLLTVIDNENGVVIGDGAVRVGKTILAGIGFIYWAMNNFRDKRFGIVGKTVGTTSQFMVSEVIKHAFLKKRYTMIMKEGGLLGARLEVKCKRYGYTNIFQIKGAFHSVSGDTILGATWMGVLFDEIGVLDKVAVTIAEDRLATAIDENGSFIGKRVYIGNPKGSQHFFNREYIEKTEEHNAIRVNFQIYDNPLISDDYIAQKKKTLPDVLWRRNYLGEWADNEQELIFTNWEVQEFNFYQLWRSSSTRNLVGTDFGFNDVTAVAIACYDQRTETIYIGNEIYKSGLKTDDIEREIRDAGIAKARNMAEFASGGDRIIEELQERGINIEKVSKGAGSILAGIEFLQTKKIIIHPSCKNAIIEFSKYQWGFDKDTGIITNTPKDKQADHFIDALRYACEPYTFNRRLVTSNAKFY